MNILLIVDCYLPSTRSSATLVHDLGTELVNSGHSVTILTPAEQDLPIKISQETVMTVVRVKSAPTKGVSRPVRGLREMRLSHLVWRRAKRFLLENRTDLIIFYSPTIFWGWLVKKLKRLYNCPAYLVLRDIFPKWALDADVMSKGLSYYLLCHYERLQYSVADVIGTNSVGDLEYFRRNFPNSRFVAEVLRNWVAEEAVAPAKVSLRAKLGLNGKIVFVYGGNIGIAQDMENILRLARNLSAVPDLHLLLVGEGTEVHRIRNRITESDLTNVSVLPGVSRSEFLSLLGQCDVGLISLDRRLTTHNIPGKLLSYGLCGLPVLASVNPGNDLLDMLNQTRSGFAYLNGNDGALISGALALAESRDLRLEMGGNCRKLVEEQFSVQSAAVTIMRHFDTTVPSSLPLELGMKAVAGN